MESLGLIGLIIALLGILALAFYESKKAGFPIVRQPTFGILDWIWPVQQVQKIRKRLFGLKCPYCRNPFQDADNNIQCPTCHTNYHNECSVEAGKCTVYGCSGKLIQKQ